MRKALLLAAALSSAAAFAALGSPASAQTAPDFKIDATTQGAVEFSGSGTAQFNNSLGNNNSFQVGSATSLGVNASASSTPEYAVTSTATLNLDNATSMSQTIGTAGVSQSKANTSTRAHDVTRTSMAERGWEAGWEYGREYEDRNGNTSTYDSQGSWEAAYTAEYGSTYQNAYSTVQGTESSSTSDGTISGTFTTSESTNADGVKNTDSNVTVNGIGSTANIVAAGSSTFDTTIGAGAAAGAGSSTSTASGSAGASLSTVSLANQSQSTNASAFIQSFGGQ